MNSESPSIIIMMSRVGTAWALTAASCICLLLVSLTAGRRASLVGVCGGGNFPCEVQEALPEVPLKRDMAPSSLPPPKSQGNPSWLSDFFEDDEFYEQPYHERAADDSFVTQPAYRDNRFWPLSPAWIPRGLKQTRTQARARQAQLRQTYYTLFPMPVTALHHERMP